MLTGRSTGKERKNLDSCSMRGMFSTVPHMTHLKFWRMRLARIVGAQRIAQGVSVSLAVRLSTEVSAPWLYDLRSKLWRDPRDCRADTLGSPCSTAAVALRAYMLASSALHPRGRGRPPRRAPERV
jgi:hypothetical protein